ncbi:MAG TPA: hypothetical protein PLC12_01205, partial [Candidatus Methanofastidiosa archaeon]|nr:hypothetical protein [Candidatus Methanofastidiosa archaeon]
MFEVIVSGIANLFISAISRATGRKPGKVSPESVADIGPGTVSKAVFDLIEWSFMWLEREIRDSRFGSMSKRAISLMREKVPPLPLRIDIPFLKGQKSKTLASPLMFIVGFVAFMGLSDHGISPFALWSIVASLAAYFIGTRVAKVRFGDLPERYSPYILTCLAISAAGYFLIGETAARLSLIPLFLILFSRRYGAKVSLCALAVGYLMLKNANFSIGFPYAFFGVLGLARNFHTERLALAIERNAYSIAAFMIFIGALYWVLDIALVGRIPLLTSREGLDPSFTMKSHLLPIGSVLFVSLLGEWGSRTGNAGRARTLSVLTIAFATVLMAFLGYRTQVLITLVAAILVAIVWDLITVSELLVSGSAIVAIFAFMTVMRTYTTGANVGLLESISVRAGLTLDIYDMMAHLGGYLGFTKGQTLIACITSFATLMPGLAFSPRRYVAVFAGAGGISMTSTIFGPFALDFGLVGVVLIMAVFGFFMQMEHNLLGTTTGRRRRVVAFLYSMTLGYMLIGI